MTQPKPNDFPDPVSTTEGGSEHVPTDTERSLSGDAEKRNESKGARRGLRGPRSLRRSRNHNQFEKNPVETLTLPALVRKVGKGAIKCI
jgi:hypothetical protein